MCGRFTVTSEQSHLEDRFTAKFTRPFKPRFNAAPGQKLPVITNQKKGEIDQVVWGLRPDWWQERNRGQQRGIINVRMETLRDRWTFSRDLKTRRCLVLADGFYEWSRANGKQPYRIVISQEKPFAMAGIWQVNNVDGKEEPEFSIITCEANEKVSSIHERMPVILDKKEESGWLADDGSWLQMLDSYPDSKINLYPVDRAVNNAGNDNPALIDRIKI